MDDWEWRCGVINGVGEALFQLNGDRVRRITRLGVVPPGRIIYEKCLISGVMTDAKEPEYDAAKLVVCHEKPKEQFITDASNAWSMLHLGNGRIKT